MQAYWNRFAFLRLVLMLILGIILAHYNEGLFWFACFFLALGFPIFFILQFSRSSNAFASKSLFSGIIAFGCCLAIGYLNTLIQSKRFGAEYLVNQPVEEVSAFKALLTSKPKATEKTYGFEGQITAVKIGDDWKSYEGRSMLYFEQSALSASFEYGDEVLIASKLNRVSGPQNPDEFNYQRYLELSQIYFQQYVKADKVQLLASDKGSTLMAYSYKASQALSKQLANYIKDEQALAIAMALTLGVKDQLEEDLKSAYATAGAMHVLAVSGLHVGIVFFLVSLAFKRWRQLKWGRWIYAIVSLLVLWAFAFITGLSPSVMRAACMFSFVVVAQASRRHTNIYNTLAASAFILLLIDPFLLFSVGFQLSYLAVFGIVYFQPKIHLLLPIAHQGLDRLWSLTSVAIAAQLVTAPLGMLYFHQFPTYFFLSNIIVIPAAFIILNGSILLLVLSFWPVAAALIGTALNYFIGWVNTAIFWLEQLPHSSLQNIYFTSYEIMAMYLVLALFALFIENRSYRYWKAMCVCVAFISISVISRQYVAQRNDLLTIHAIPNGNAMSYVVGDKAFMYSVAPDSLLQEKIGYHVAPYIQSRGASIYSVDSSFSHFPLSYRHWQGLEMIRWHGKSLVKHDRNLNLKLGPHTKSLNIDYLILSNNVWQESSSIFELFSPKLVVIDGSNSYYTIRRLKKWLEEQEINYYVVPESGALAIKV